MAKHGRSGTARKKAPRPPSEAVEKVIARSTPARGGHFQAGPHPLLHAANRSIGFDIALLPFDVRGSQAHARMLGECGIISRAEAGKLVRGLEKIAGEIDTIGLVVKPEDEDVHMAVERRLGELIGPVAGKLHTGRSRNDQVALDARLYVRQAIDGARDRLRDAIAALLDLAEAHLGVILPAYTHLQPAQPVLLAHHLLAYVEMFSRDRERLFDARARVNRMPLGAGACTGTTFPIDRAMVARELGFDGLCANSMDAVSDRDFIVEFLSCAALVGAHVSRLGEELIRWSSAEVGFAGFSDRVTTGSSIMPQKKNLDGAELARGKAGRLIGNLVTMLAVLKGLPMAYMKDLQEDKEPLFDSVRTLEAVLPLVTLMVREMTVHEDVMRAAGEGPASFLAATEVADFLAGKGMPFRQAHHLVGRIVRHCQERGIGLADLTLDEWQTWDRLFDAGIIACLTPEAAVKRRDLPGGTAPRRVKAALSAARRALARETGEQGRARRTRAKRQL